MLRRFAAALSSSDDENDDVDAFLEDADRLERQSLIVEQEREDDSEALLLNASSLGMMDGGRNPQDDSVESSGREEDEQERGNGNSSSRSLSFPSSPSDMSPLRHLVEVPLDSTTSSILTDTARGRFLRSRPSSKDGAEAMLILQQQQQQQQQPLFSASRNLPQQHVLLSSSELPLQPLQQTRSQSCARTRSSPPARHASANSENSTSSSVNNKHSTLLSSLLLSTSSSSSSTRCGVHCMAMVMLWIAVVSLVVAIIWYSYELFNHGTDPHLIAWFSAGAFVLLGFPVSMWGIWGHLTNYNAPEIQVYIVRILWMVPIYSIESWLAMRFTEVAVYIETGRDVYESFVLYCFLQFLIQVLGGEDALVLMLKDKSPTRGVHMWGLQWCGVKPWLMGQPVRREEYDGNGEVRRTSMVERVAAAMSPVRPRTTTPTSRVTWTSPFFIRCKFGVLQYVLIKALCAVATLLLEWKGWYKEGQFHYSAGYLYICFITNVSQCWALYCLIFFYYATKTELSPIRPVGKFLSVKALVFFTWWQSVFISSLYQMDMIPQYSRNDHDMSSDDVAKGIQDYLICIEMFAAAIVHSFVFPHSDYSVAAVRARANAIHQRQAATTKRLGRRHHRNPSQSNDVRGSKTLYIPDTAGLELVPFDDNSTDEGSVGTWEEPLDTNNDDAILLQDQRRHDDLGPDNDNDDEYQQHHNRPGFFRAFLDSAIPRDLRDNTVNIMRGEYHVEKKTLLHHAATSDQYDLFSARRAYTAAKKLRTSKPPTGG